MNKYIFGVLLLFLGGMGWWWYQGLVTTSDTAPQPSQTDEQRDTAVDDGMLAAGETQTLLMAETWVWEETLMNDGTVITPAEADAFTLTFTADGQVQGTTDCNNFSGAYELNDTELSVGPLAMTKMYCEDSQEQEFQGMVTEAQLVFFDEEGHLVLLLPYDSGSVMFRPQD